MSEFQLYAVRGKKLSEKIFHSYLIKSVHYRDIKDHSYAFSVVILSLLIILGHVGKITPLLMLLMQKLIFDLHKHTRTLLN